nr:Sigma-70 region 3 [uncultured bacterium]
MVETMSRVTRVTRDLTVQLGRAPTSEEVAAVMSEDPRTPMTAERVEEIRRFDRQPVSLETPVGDEGDAELGDLIEDRDAVSPLDAVADRMLKEQLASVLNSLDGREQRVLRLRFGLDDGHAADARGGRTRVRPHPRADPADRVAGAAKAAPPVTEPEAPRVRDGITRL